MIKEISFVVTFKEAEKNWWAKDDEKQSNEEYLTDNIHCTNGAGVITVEQIHALDTEKIYYKDTGITIKRLKDWYKENKETQYGPNHIEAFPYGAFRDGEIRGNWKADAPDTAEYEAGPDGHVIDFREVFAAD